MIHDHDKTTVKLRFKSFAIFTLSSCSFGVAPIFAQPSDSGISTKCVLCPGSDITLPEKELSIPNYEFIASCGNLNSTIGLFFKDGDEQCTLLQGLSSLCGCPTPDNACELCSTPTSTNQEEGARLLSYPNKTLEFLSELFGGFTPSCEMLAAFLKGNALEGDGQCSSSQLLLSKYCGCGVEELDEVEPTQSMCTLCPSGEAAPFRTKHWAFLVFLSTPASNWTWQ
jgi:hypothetical protein